MPEMETSDNLTKYLLIFATLILCTSASSSSIYEEHQIVYTQDGAVRGHLNHSLFFYTPYYSFRGIPFAASPIGDLRFKAPIPPKPWNGTLNASGFKTPCIQTVRSSLGVSGDEDCLYLNVFVPAKPISNLYSVMIFISGGAYISGDASSYGPDFLIEKDVILVTFNYRIGAIGFLSLGTPTYSGNMGLKDQVMTFKWVKQNIRFFGGDPHTVTIFGQSAGAASIGLHLVSPASRGLFARSIMESGSPLDPWGYISTTSQQKQVLKFARRYANSSQFGEPLTEFLRNCKAYTIERHTFRYFVQGPPPITMKPVWAPIIEVEGAVDPFMQKSPIELMLEKHKPKNMVETMFGFNSNEAIYFVPLYIQNPILLGPINEKFQVQLPYSFIKYNYSSQYYLNAAADIQSFYFGQQPLDVKTFPSFTNLLSDAWLSFGIFKMAQIQQERGMGKVFFYKNSVVTKLNMFRGTCGAEQAGIPGATHCDELFYLFRIAGQLFYHEIGNIYGDLSYHSEEIRMIRMFTGIWTDFAKHGNPTLNQNGPQVNPVTKDHFNYMHLTNRGVKLGKNPDGSRMQFWNDFFKKHNFNLKQITYCPEAVEY